MKTKKRKIANKARNTGINRKKARSKFKGAPKKVARKKGKRTTVQVAQASVGAPETTVAAYEVIETQVYEEGNIEIGGQEEECGT
jgi:hypothetical protein